MKIFLAEGLMAGEARPEDNKDIVFGWSNCLNSSTKASSKTAKPLQRLLNAAGWQENEKNRDLSYFLQPIQ